MRGIGGVVVGCCLEDWGWVLVRPYRWSGKRGLEERSVNEIVLMIDLENADGVWSVARSVYKERKVIASVSQPLRDEDGG